MSKRQVYRVKPSEFSAPTYVVANSIHEVADAYPQAHEIVFKFTAYEALEIARERKQASQDE